jgi:hypothetical protein
MCDNDETFLFWHRFIYIDCGALINFYLAGRRGIWHLRNFALKTMAPLFHVTQSTYYYRLIPYHLADLKRFPNSVLTHFSNGGFVVSLTGNAWASVFADECQEMTINKDTKQVVNSINQISMVSKLHYIIYRAKLHKNFLNFLEPEQKAVHYKDSVGFSKVHRNNVKSLYDKLKDANLFKFVCNVGDPAEPGSSSHQMTLKHIFSGHLATEAIKNSLLNFRVNGEMEMQSHIKCHITNETYRLVGQKKKKIVLQNFGVKQKKSRVQQSLEKQHKCSSTFHKKNYGMV